MKTKDIETKSRYAVRRFIDMVSLALIVVFGVSGAVIFLWKDCKNDTIKKIYLISLFVVLGILSLVYGTELIFVRNIKKKIFAYIDKAEYTEAEEYLKGLPRIRIFCDIIDLYHYYYGIICLYLNRETEAIYHFEDLDLEKNYSDLDIQLSGLLYLYLIYKSSNNTDGTRRISDIYADRKKTYLKVTQRWRTLSRDMQVMDNFLQNDTRTIGSLRAKRISF